MATVTKTLKSSGGDYSSIVTWESTEQTDLVFDGDVHVLECYKGTTTTGNWQADGSLDESVTITDWTTGASNYITIKAAAGEGHEGVIDAGFVIKETPTGAQIMYLQQDYSRLYGFQISGTSSTSSKSALRMGGTNLLIESMIVTLDTSYNACHSVYGVSQTDSYADTTIRNCLIKNSYVGSSLASYCIGNYGSTAISGIKIDNCTLVGGRAGVTNSSNVTGVLQNVIAIDGGLYDIYITTIEFTGNDCASSDNSADDENVGTVVSVSTSDGVDFVEPSTNNYQPTSGGKLAGEGADLSGTFTDDITGATRSTWDIGAFIAAAGGATPHNPFGLALKGPFRGPI